MLNNTLRSTYCINTNTSVIKKNHKIEEKKCAKLSRSTLPFKKQVFEKE